MINDYKKNSKKLTIKDEEQKKYYTINIPSEAANDFLKDLKGVSTVNININIQNIQNGSNIIVYEKRPSVETNLIPSPIKDKTHNHSSPDKLNLNSPSRWRKLTNIIRSVKSFCRYDTKNIGNEIDIDNDLKDYKNRLHNNTLKSRQDFRLEESFNMLEGEYEEYNENLKHQVVHHILE